MDEHFIDASRLAWPTELAERPLALIDLDGASHVEIGPLPPFPVIGVGDPAHPLAPQLDAVVQPPFTVRGIVNAIMANPRAAQVTTQLLRAIDSLPVEDALVAESLAYAALQASAEHRHWIAARDRRADPPPPGSVSMHRVGHRLTVTLDRAQAGNAIDRPMRDALHEALALAAIDPEIGRVSLRANGRSFSLGAELSEFGTTTDPATAHAIRMRTLPAHMAARCAHKLDAHVQGACIGAGLELAAWAGRLTAAPDAWFQLPELAMGILPGAGGCVSLSRRIGRARTTLMILSGRRISARHALALGLIDAIVDDPAADHGHGDVAGIQP